MSDVNKKPRLTPDDVERAREKRRQRIEAATPVAGSSPAPIQDHDSSAPLSGAQEGIQPSADRWRHKKRGTTYTIVGEAILQAVSAFPLSDYAQVVVYRNEADPICWDELIDAPTHWMPAPRAAPSPEKGEPADG